MKELSKNLMCIKMMSGVELWVEQEKAEKLINLLGTTKTHFVEVGGETINSLSVEGVFTAKTMADLTHRKNGDWLCTKGVWHERNTQCACPITNEKGETFIKGSGWIKS